MIDKRPHAKDRSIADIFGRRLTSHHHQQPRPSNHLHGKTKDYQVDVPEWPASSDDDDDDDIKAEVKEFIRLKSLDDDRRKPTKRPAQAGRGRASIDIFDSHEGIVQTATDIDRQKRKAKENEKRPSRGKPDGRTRRPLEVISNTMLLTDYDDRATDGYSIFKSYEYQQVGNFNDSLLDSKRGLQPANNRKPAGIEVDTSVFTIIIPGSHRPTCCPRCGEHLDKAACKSPQLVSAKPQPRVKDVKPSMLRKHVKPAVVEPTNRSKKNLAELCGVLSKTDRSVSRSSIEKPGNYIKPGSRHGKPMAGSSVEVGDTKRSASRLSIDSNSPIFRTGKESTSRLDKSDLKKSAVTIASSKQNKENQRGSLDRLNAKSGLQMNPKRPSVAGPKTGKAAGSDLQGLRSKHVGKSQYRDIHQTHLKH